MSQTRKMLTSWSEHLLGAGQLNVRKMRQERSKHRESSAHDAQHVSPAHMARPSTVNTRTPAVMADKGAVKSDREDAQANHHKQY